MHWTLISLMQEISQKRGNTRWGSLTPLPIMRRLDGCTFVCYSRESEALGHNTWIQLQLRTLRISTTSPHPPQTPWGTLSSSSPSLLTICSTLSVAIVLLNLWANGWGEVHVNHCSGSVPSLPPAQVCVPVHECMCECVCTCSAQSRKLCKPENALHIPKSRNCTQISRISSQSWDCIIRWRNLKITWVGSIWQLVIRETVHRWPPSSQGERCHLSISSGRFSQLARFCNSDYLRLSFSEVLLWAIWNPWLNAAKPARPGGVWGHAARENLWLYVFVSPSSLFTKQSARGVGQGPCAFTWRRLFRMH